MYAVNTHAPPPRHTHKTQKAKNEQPLYFKEEHLYKIAPKIKLLHQVDHQRNKRFISNVG